MAASDGDLATFLQYVRVEATQVAIASNGVAIHCIAELRQNHFNRRVCDDLNSCVEYVELPLGVVLRRDGSSPSAKYAEACITYVFSSSNDFVAIRVAGNESSQSIFLTCKSLCLLRVSVENSECLGHSIEPQYWHGQALGPLRLDGHPTAPVESTSPLILG